MELDQLTEDALEARKCGMTYGKYKASQQPVKIEPREEKPLVGTETKICEYCGCEYIPDDRRKRRTCGAYCRKLLQSREMREKYYKDRGMDLPDK